MGLPYLLLLPALKAPRVSPQEIILTQKFIDGVLEYQKYWSGSVLVWMEEDSSPSSNLDNVTVRLAELPFQVQLVNLDQVLQTAALPKSSLVLASAGYRQNAISSLCQRQGIPCVYVTEYSWQTRLQIINTTTTNPLLRLRRYLWETLQENKQRKAISLAQGVQCNGTPTYKAYQTLNPHPLLYFDNRITADMLATEEEVSSRTQALNPQKPLHLLFSGRLTKIKGVDDLLLVAQELRKLGVNFTLFICGDGDLQPYLEREISAQELSNYVKMLGVLEFKRELVPFVKKNIDLFVCCHRQGDPSCTYLETMSCGVPIVGYDNEAWRGIVETAGVGWLVEMNQPRQMAQLIASRSKTPEVLTDAAFRSLAFARGHTFEKTFTARVDHLRKLLSLSRS